jgi:chemotaxis protein CheD
VNLIGELIVVGVGSIRVGRHPDELVTYALGSCIGVAAWDAAAKVGGLWHVALPSSSVNPERGLREPGAFADTGAAAFFKALAEAGASTRRLRLWMAGGSENPQMGGGFEIGRRNALAVRKELWQRGLLLDGEDCGGQHSRTLRLDLGSGQARVRGPFGHTVFGG